MLPACARDGCDDPAAFLLTLLDPDGRRIDDGADAYCTACTNRLSALLDPRYTDGSPAYRIEML